MADKENIITELKCQNIAPIEECEAIIKHIEEKFKGQIEYLSQQKY